MFERFIKYIETQKLRYTTHTCPPQVDRGIKFTLWIIYISYKQVYVVIKGIHR